MPDGKYILPSTDAAVLDQARVPDFIVIGAMRAGTTTLYHHLAGHPEIGMSRMKETDFFVRKINYPLGPDWYSSQFDPGFACHGEVSPNYAKHDLWRGVPKLIKATVPEVKLVFIARDPVARFRSHYQHSWYAGRISLTPEELLDSGNGAHMLETSRYAAQIGSYLEHFRRDQILILDFDQLRTEPQGVLDQVTDFLGLERHVIRDVASRNDAASVSRIPGVVQRAWSSRAVRRLDRYISRGMRDRARQIVSMGPARKAPDFSDVLVSVIAERLAEDAAAFRELTGMSFDSWRV
ncbi:sulfotransferase [Poseidonocella sp. HB161398]|uniref:sulfotransferase family protein n=1 Tax=Poseidonocella sp. HB161398 TaxID=2320855 RepID=UPI0011085B6D|nr:sulfotransferase domain-containing protein [Poseidonocella sp. HB161398]